MKLCTQCHRAFPDDAQACPSHGQTLQIDPLIGLQLGGFTVEEWLREGRTGVEYRAQHDEIKRRAVVKVIRLELSTNQEVVARFRQEARAVARIGNPHLIDVFDIGTTPDGRLYYIMELLDGRTLAALCAERRLSFAEFGPIIKETLEALEAAHQAGVIHRDLKPENLFLNERPGEAPFVKVLDFGVARVLSQSTTDVGGVLDQGGHVVGTPAYMAPEQIADHGGRPIDHRADLYAVGVILYELATGTTPFRSDTPMGMLRAHLEATPPPFSAARLSDGVTPELEAVVFKALARRPDDRYWGARELRDDLVRVLELQEPSALKWYLERSPTAHPTGAPIVTLRSGSAAMPAVAPPKAESPKPSASTRYAILGALLLALGPGLAVTLKLLKPRHAPSPIARPRVRVVEKTPPLDPARLRASALSVVEGALRSNEPALRRRATRAIAEGRDPSERPLVEPLLGDADRSVRESAAAALGSLGSRAALPALRAALGKNAHSDPALAEAMMRLGDEEGRRRLQQALAGSDEAARFPSALALFAVLPEARRVLEKRIATSAPTDPTAIDLLGRLAGAGDEHARQTLAARLEGGSPEAELAVADALARMGDERGRAKLLQIAGSAAGPRLGAYRALAALDDQSGYRLFQSTFADPTLPAADRALAAEGLGASGEKAALAVLAPGLDEKDAAVRLAAAAGVLAILAADPRLAAARSLEWARTALADASPAVRAEAAFVLGDALAAASVPLLGGAIHDPQPEVRRTAAGSLGRTRAGAAVPYLGEALDDTKREVRVEAMRSMARIADRAAAPHLTRHLARARSDEKMVAAGVLSQLGDTSHAAEVNQGLGASDPEVRRLAVEAAGADRAAGKERLTAALADRAPAVRLEAAIQLAEQNLRDGVTELQRALQRGGLDGLRAYAALVRLGVAPEGRFDPQSALDARDPAARLKAVESAPRLPWRQALALLRRALRDPDAGVRQAAARAAGDFAEGESAAAAIALLKRAVADDDPAVRAQAGALLGKHAAPADNPTPTSPSSTDPSSLGAPSVPPPSAPPPPIETPAESKWEDGQLAMTSGQVALRSGNYEEAVTELRRAHKLNPKLPVYFSLGEAYRKIGDHEGDAAKKKESYTRAIQSYRRASEKEAAELVRELEAELR